MGKIFKADISLVHTMKLAGLPISVGVQNNRPVVWYVTSHTKRAELQVVMTGEDALIEWKYLDTFQLNQDYLVCHVYWRQL